jgi:two-component system, NtrC family, nitrogen regulation sensor histidine kinase NtrY
VNNTKVISKRTRTIITGVLLFILFWIVIIKIFTSYFVNKVDDEWNIINIDNISKQDKSCINEFNKYVELVNEFSNDIKSNLDIQKFLNDNDSKKLFEKVLTIKLPQNLNFEIYNKRLELASFNGKKISPDFLSLQQTINGKEIYFIKEIGFSKYLVNIFPVKNKLNNDAAVGVGLVSYLLESNYPLNNNFFRNNGISYDLTKNLKIDIELIVNKSFNNEKSLDSNNITGNRYLKILNKSENLIGYFKISSYDINMHKKVITDNSLSIVSVLIFLFSMVLIIYFIYYSKAFSSFFVKSFLFLVILIAVRYLWILFEFPGRLFPSDLFSSKYYAVTFGYGIMKSLADACITVIFIFGFIVYLLRNINFENIKEPGTELKTVLKRILYFILILLSFLALTNIYEILISSLIYDSNIKFYEPSQIIPGNELFIILTVIFICTISYYYLISVLMFSFSIHLKKISQKVIIKKIRFIIILVSVIISYVLFISFVGSRQNSYYIIIPCIILVTLFTAYLNKEFFKSRKIKFFAFKSFSYLVVIFIITTPFLILENLQKQEVKYIELLGKNLAKEEKDKASFLIADELTNFSQDDELFNNVQKSEKVDEMSFYIWAKSKLKSESFNTAAYLLDTNGKIISSFNISPVDINTDSVQSFILREYFNADSTEQTEKTEPDSSVNNTEKSDEEIMTKENINISNGSIDIMDNFDEKLTVGISPIEYKQFRNTPFEKIIGYIVIAANYESKSVFSDNTSAIFNVQSSRELKDKLFSQPNITKFINGDIEKTTNIEIAKLNLRNIELFKDYIKNKTEKFSWRYESNNLDEYKTFYILNYVFNPETNERDENIYTISIKRNDFSVSVFFIFRIILFSSFIFLVFYIAYIIKFIFQYKLFKFDFKNKLFISFLIVSVIPIVFLAGYTREYILNKNEVSIQNQILSDLNLINESIKSKKLISTHKNQDSLKIIQRNILNQNLSNPDKNFNLFIKDKLISTTNSELYDSDLFDKRLDAEAYFNIYGLNKDLFLNNLSLSNASYLAGYKPVKDKNGNIIAVLSSKSIYKQNEINKELNETLTFIFGSYICAIILLLFMVNIFSNKLSKPIFELKSATEKLIRGETNFEIRIKRNDELGMLVDSFNKMTKQLTRSRIELKKAEREAAWRDIARRVAHEIKNPLTPMKLSIQHLYEIYNGDKKIDFSAALTKTQEMMIKEIDKLNRIATEFSNFAKLPGQNYTILNINEIISEVVDLYSMYDNIKFVLDLDINLNLIKADRQELNRALQNIVKNSVQSISGNGYINILTNSIENKIILTISDNGCGIDNDTLKNLFTPNFSTKSTGMGLGLAIAKKTFDDLRAEIKYESEINKGTKATIIFNSVN